MRIMDEPLFLRDNEWHYYDHNECIFKLTEEGQRLKRVRDSYEQFYKELNEGDEENEGN